jgi:hypothetical protein
LSGIKKMRVSLPHLEKLIREELEKELPPWHKPGEAYEKSNVVSMDPASRVKDLSKQAMEAQCPPPPPRTSRGESISISDEDVLSDIYRLLMNSGEAWQGLAPRFMEMMKEKGFLTADQGSEISGGQKIDNLESFIS